MFIKNLYLLFLLLIFRYIPLYSANFIDKGYYVIDLKNKVEWLKCSAGQQWSDEKLDCIGEPVKLDLDEVKTANQMINDQLGGKWRLPNRKELESLVCKKCKDVKINLDLFPNTPAQPFWTSQRNWWSPKFFWSVNFFTGHSYGRFVPQKKLFIRFLRER
tara:strand:+ start:442 stop:921 length:480 start_codon:yes stop_codon:yes gene_type:complete